MTKKLKQTQIMKKTTIYRILTALFGGLGFATMCIALESRVAVLLVAVAALCFFIANIFFNKSNQ